jgi:hypothetical protein
MTSKATTSPKIELRNLKVAEFASQETTCYEATVYVDGKRFCIARNEGSGGDDSYDAIGPKGGFKTGEEAGAARRELDENVHNIALRHNPNAVRNYKDVPETELKPWIDDDAERHAEQDREMAEEVVTSWSVFEYLVNAALTRALYAKDLKRLMAKRVVMIDEGAVMQTKTLSKPRLEVALDQFRTTEPNLVILNDKPFDEALDLFIGAAG